MKVLFLDIDGVLNSHRTAIAFGSMFGVEKLDPIAIRLVRGIVDAADACVVLSSSWRLMHDWRDLGKALDLPIIDRTPSMLGPRGREIQAWLDSHPECDSYAIVDDDGDMLPEQLPFFVKTNMQDGLTWACAERLCGLLGARIYDVNRAAPLAAAGRTLQWDDAPTTTPGTPEGSAVSRMDASGVAVRPPCQPGTCPMPTVCKDGCSRQARANAAHGVKTCGKCHGEGRVNGEAVCRRCDGTGLDKHDPWCVGGEQDGICNCGADGSP